MAEPAHRQLEDESESIYDTPSGTSPSDPRPHLRALEGGGETTPRAGNLHSADSEAETSKGLSDAEEMSGSGGASFYRRPENKKGRFSAKQLLSKRGAIGAGILAAIIASIIALFMSLIPGELLNIKHVVTDKIGGVSARTYSLGRNRLYSTQFFFDKDNNNAFDGDKVGGIRRLMFENRKTNSMVKTLRDNGYQITFDQRTGKVKALAKVDENGKPIPDQTYTGNGPLDRAWSIRSSGDLENILREVYPDKSDFWYSRSTKMLYRRWGLTRTNWLKDMAKTVTGVSKVESLELQFRSALRQKLFGNSGGDISDTELTKKGDTAEDAKQKAANKGLIGKVQDSAKSLRDKLLKDPSAVPDASLEEAAAGAVSGPALQKDLGSAVKSSISIASLNVLNADQRVCQADSALNDVVTGARILRASQLMAFSLSVLNIADAVQNGKSVSAQQVNALMQYLNSTDKNGKTMFASSGWLFWNDPPKNTGSLFTSYDKNQRDEYSAGGGFTGTLAGIKGRIDSYKLSAPCGIVGNPFVSILGLGVSLGLGVLSGGTFTATDVGFNVAISFATSFAIGVATQMLTPIVAGTIINGAEQGTAIGNAFISGAETLTAANASSEGMRPLTNNEYKVAYADLQNDQQAQLSRESIATRLFSPDNENSLTTLAATKLSGFKLSSLTSAPSSIFKSLLNIGSIFSPHASADGGGDCPDPTFKDHDLVSTPFCNPVMGIPDSVMNSPDYAPDVVDAKMSCLDNNGNKTCSNPQVDTDGNPLPGTDYMNYVIQCTSDSTNQYATDGIDVLHSRKDGKYKDTCTDKNPNINLFNTYHLYLDIAQSENDALTGNLSGTPGASNLSTPTTSTASTSSSPSGDAKQLAQQILDAANAGKIKFNILNSNDTYDGSTPEQNIKEMAAGQPASTTSTCQNRGAIPPNTTVSLDSTLLQFILELSQVQTIQINALAGQCHGESTSNHYQGKAVDFGCPFDPSSANSIGAKYGISDQTGETCANSGHYHYSIGGH